MQDRETGQTHKSSGQFFGCDSLCPPVRTANMSSAGVSSYGSLPRVIISHNTTPNDHCVYWVCVCVRVHTHAFMHNQECTPVWVYYVHQVCTMYTMYIRYVLCILWTPGMYYVHQVCTMYTMDTLDRQWTKKTFQVYIFTTWLQDMQCGQHRQTASYTIQCLAIPTYLPTETHTCTSTSPLPHTHHI